MHLSAVCNAGHQDRTPLQRSSANGGVKPPGVLSGVNLMVASAQSMRDRFYAESTVADSDSEWEE